MICQKINLSLRWLLSGEGFPFRSITDSNPIDPMKINKGAGIRLSKMRHDAEEGIMDDDLTEFIMALDEFKKKNKKTFLSSSDIYQITLFLGYRKVADKAAHIECIGEN